MSGKLSAKHRTGQLFYPVPPCMVPRLRQRGICLFELAFVKAAVGQGDDGGFFCKVDQNNYIGFDSSIFIAIDVLEIRRQKRGRYRNGQG
ncbi:hypothetical protein O8B93_00665 [Agrobacterium rhizogenes]|uniref:hypothetical protein n=1 Tax=Rhizobium rhizogenes TaxID=359 RepID=UPI0022B63FAA|nr:hypothetical protein [Rhizobium rhizogenes]MCZ7446097.1 hypothetical protein [Rhizobium rhizogenes]